MSEDNKNSDEESTGDDEVDTCLSGTYNYEVIT